MDEPRDTDALLPAGKKLSKKQKKQNISSGISDAFISMTPLDINDRSDYPAANQFGAQAKTVVLSHNLPNLENNFSVKEIKGFMNLIVNYKVGNAPQITNGYFVFLSLLDQIHTKNKAGKYLYEKVLTAVREVAFERLAHDAKYGDGKKGAKNIPDVLLFSFVNESLEKSNSLGRFGKWRWKNNFCSAKNRPVRLALDRINGAILSSKAQGNLNGGLLAALEKFPEELITVALDSSNRSLEAADVKNFPKIQRVWDEYKIASFQASLYTKNIREFYFKVNQREVDPQLLESLIRGLIHRINASCFTGKYEQMLRLCLIRLMHLSSPKEGLNIAPELLKSCLTVMNKNFSKKKLRSLLMAQDERTHKSERIPKNIPLFYFIQRRLQNEADVFAQYPNIYRLSVPFISVPSNSNALPQFNSNVLPQSEEGFQAIIHSSLVRFDLQNVFMRYLLNYSGSPVLRSLVHFYGADVNGGMYEGKRLLLRLIERNGIELDEGNILNPYGQAIHFLLSHTNVTVTQEDIDEAAKNRTESGVNLHRRLVERFEQQANAAAGIEPVFGPFVGAAVAVANDNNSASVKTKLKRFEHEFTAPQNLKTVLDRGHYDTNINALVIALGSGVTRLTPSQVWKLCERHADLSAETIGFLRAQDIAHFDFFLAVINSGQPAYWCLVELLQQQNYRTARVLLSAVKDDLLNGVLKKDDAHAPRVQQWQKEFKASVAALDATAQQILRENGFGEYLPAVSRAAVAAVALAGSSTVRSTAAPAAPLSKGKEEAGSVTPPPAVAPASHTDNADVVFGEFQGAAKTNLDILREALQTRQLDDINNLAIKTGEEVEQLTYHEKIALWRCDLTHEVRQFLHRNGVDDSIIALASLYGVIDLDGFSFNVDQHIERLDVTGMQDLCSRQEYLEKLCEHELTEESEQLLKQYGVTDEQIDQGRERGKEKRANYLRDFRSCLSEKDTRYPNVEADYISKLGSAVRQLTTAEINTLLLMYQLPSGPQQYLVANSFFTRLCRVLEIKSDGAKNIDDLLNILKANHAKFKAFVKTEAGRDTWRTVVEAGDPAVLEFFIEIGEVDVDEEIIGTNQSPLLFAIERELLESIRVLVANGATITPEMFARARNIANQNVFLTLEKFVLGRLTEILDSQFYSQAGEVNALVHVLGESITKLSEDHKIKLCRHELSEDAIAALQTNDLEMLAYLSPENEAAGKADRAKTLRELKEFLGNGFRDHLNLVDTYVRKLGSAIKELTPSEVRKICEAKLTPSMQNFLSTYFDYFNLFYAMVTGNKSFLAQLQMVFTETSLGAVRYKIAEDLILGLQHGEESDRFRTYLLSDDPMVKDFIKDAVANNQHSLLDKFQWFGVVLPEVAAVAEPLPKLVSPRAELTASMVAIRAREGKTLKRVISAGDLDTTAVVTLPRVNSAGNLGGRK